MLLRMKRAIPMVVVVFAAYYLFTRPDKAAASVNGVFDMVLAGANSLAVFLTSLAG